MVLGLAEPQRQTEPYSAVESLDRCAAQRPLPCVRLELIGSGAFLAPSCPPSSRGSGANRSPFFVGSRASVFCDVRPGRRRRHTRIGPPRNVREARAGRSRRVEHILGSRQALAQGTPCRALIIGGSSDRSSRYSGRIRQKKWLAFLGLPIRFVFVSSPLPGLLAEFRPS